ncbi:metallophosphoesterase family protein [Radiobacillus deserti]|uniref:Phosphoesterase n=1 Tax=Radiobacillus deserti TaxID=2594883 RepID=A0A516KC95_9BACI|nr:metallophosphoesterase family protein [Radiobacillus deserti]QDP38977.1 metallophosphoesterase family protein [Radiobacillus deserti]
MDTNIAIITDIHGNDAALEAVLDDINRQPISHIYCLGDLLGIGYQSNEVLQRLTTRQGVTFVKGNHDQAILDIWNGKEPESEGKEKVHHQWIAKNVDPSFQSFLEGMPMEQYAEYNGKTFLFRHYHLDKNLRFLPIDPEPSSNKLDQVYENVEADVVLFGHHHILHHFKSNQRLYVNPGSLGCSYQAKAPYACITIKADGGIDVCLKEVPYNQDAFIKGFEERKVPDRESILRIFYGQ